MYQIPRTYILYRVFPLDSNLITRPLFSLLILICGAEFGIYKAYKVCIWMDRFPMQPPLYLSSFSALLYHAGKCVGLDIDMWWYWSAGRHVYMYTKGGCPWPCIGLDDRDSFFVQEQWKATEQCFCICTTRKIVNHICTRRIPNTSKIQVEY